MNQKEYDDVVPNFGLRKLRHQQLQQIHSVLTQKIHAGFLHPVDDGNGYFHQEQQVRLFQSLPDTIN